MDGCGYVRRRLRRRRGIPASNDGAIVIRAGLSVVVRGHLVGLHRDEQRRIATVCVTLIEGHVTNGTEGPEVEAAAAMLAERARRFLSQDWTIVRWSPPADAPPVKRSE